MDYSKKIDEVRQMVADLRKFKKTLLQLEDDICSIENRLTIMDESLPTDKQIASMAPGLEKEQILRLIDLDDMAFELIDEMLGPPSEDVPEPAPGTTRGPGGMIHGGGGPIMS